MYKNILFLWLVLVLGLFHCAVSQAAADEPCLVRYDQQDNVFRIPCVVINEQRLWASLRPSSAEQGKLAVDAAGEGFLPFWIIQLIEQTENAPVENPPKVITQHSYRGTAVYEVSAPCCDQYNYLYDAAGKVVCAPNGGFTGSGDGQCPDFSANKTNSVVIWKDQRKQ